ncbi:MAG: sporulation protein [Actinobacteria bacterium]|nr:MAG: sporulation protein [Actinomycetota bacterium]
MDFRDYVRELVQEISQNVKAETVFGESRQIGDKVVIPVASIGYGGGGGGGMAPQTEREEGGTGGGGGLGIKAKPLGVVVVTQDTVEWLPTLDATRVVITGFIVAIVAVLALRSAIYARNNISCTRVESEED